MEWMGTVDIPEGEPLKLRLEATTPAQVFLNGKLVLSAQGKRGGENVEGEVGGQHGRVPILVRNVRPAGDDWLFWKLRLLWREPGGGWDAAAFEVTQPRNVRLAITRSRRQDHGARQKTATIGQGQSQGSGTGFRRRLDARNLGGNQHLGSELHRLHVGSRREGDA